jgi:hypothetical protein
MADQAKNRASEVADQAKETAEAGKDQAASGLKRAAHRHFAPTWRGYAEMMAERMITDPYCRRPIETLTT